MTGALFNGVLCPSVFQSRILALYFVHVCFLVPLSENSSFIPFHMMYKCIFLWKSIVRIFFNHCLVCSDAITWMDLNHLKSNDEKVRFFQIYVHPNILALICKCSLDWILTKDLGQFIHYMMAGWLWLTVSGPAITACSWCTMLFFTSWQPQKQSE